MHFVSASLPHHIIFHLPTQAGLQIDPHLASWSVYRKRLQGPATTNQELEKFAREKYKNLNHNKIL